MTPSSLFPAQAPELRSRCHGGATCNSIKPWPLHHVWHGTALLHLCTSCVLRLLPAAFCFLCLDPVNISTSSSPPLARCHKCFAVAHQACLSTSHTSAVFCLCPACSTPHRSISYYPPDHRPLSASHDYTLDLRSAKALLTASQLAATSINYAADVARSESERKVLESAAARKRARKKIDAFFKKEAKYKNKLGGALALSVKKNAEDEEAPIVTSFAGNCKEEKCGIEVKGSENGVKEERETDNWMHQLSLNSFSDAPMRRGNRGNILSDTGIDS